MKKILLCILIFHFTFFVKSQVSKTFNNQALKTPSICMVTTNEAGKYNEIIWHKEDYPEAKKFIIHRLFADGKFRKIGEVDASADGIYTDNTPPNNYGNPNDTAREYILTYEAEKMGTSPESAIHKAILLEGNKKGVFSWNDYLIGGKKKSDESKYSLWRMAPRGKPELVGETPNTIFFDSEFSQVRGKNYIWWVSLGDFNCDGGKTGTKSNNSNE